MNFEVNLIILIKPFFLHDRKVVTKIQISGKQKELLRLKKAFSSFLKGFQSSKKCKFFLEGESPSLNKILKKTFTSPSKNTTEKEKEGSIGN